MFHELRKRGTSAADLKFLHRLRQTHFRNFKSKSGTRIICLLVPLLLPKFVSEGAAMYHELRKRGTSASAQSAPNCPTMRKVNVGVSVAPPNVVHTSPYVAKALGLFAKRCIDAAIIQF